MRRIEPFSADGKHVRPNGSDTDAEARRTVNRLRERVQHRARSFADRNHVDVCCRPQSRGERIVSERSADQTSRVGGTDSSKQNLTKVGTKVGSGMGQ